MLVLGLHAGYHDVSATLFDEYEVLGAVALERLNRRKGSGVDPERWAWPCVDELLSMRGLTRRDIDCVALTQSALPRIHYRDMKTPLRRFANTLFPARLKRRPTKLLHLALRHKGVTDPNAIFDGGGFLAEAGFRSDVRIHWCNHHFAHALPSLFFTDWPEALLCTIDAIGDNASYSAHSFRGRELKTLFGGDEALLQPQPEGGLGDSYANVTIALGFRRGRHEGKVTGLAAFGEPVLYEKLASRFSIDAEGRVRSHWSNEEMQAEIATLVPTVRREDAAASIQKVLEDTVLKSVRRLLELHPHRRLGLAGGVFGNVRLNRILAEQAGVDEVFVVPPMNDEGLSLGAALAFLLRRDGVAAWLESRRRLDNIYWGRSYDDKVDAAMTGESRLLRTGEACIEGAARRLAEGQIGALYVGRMEFGPRALGARSILANPSRRATHDELNRRLSRTEFMPFAPVIMEHKAPEVFGVTGVNAYACRFMTITTDVQPRWRSAIEAVVHVDGSARPQTIRRETNPLYYDILAEFEKRTGLPVLVNTSFNVHEEPIVNAPPECIRALTEGRVDFIVTKNSLYVRADGRALAPVT